MATATLELDKAPSFSIQDSAIDEMEREYMVLAVDDPSDKQQIAVVRKARLSVREARIAVEKRRKELKEDALRYGQAVDAEARRIKERLEPIESHLQFHEDAAKREAERIAKEKEAKRQAMIRERLSLLSAAEYQTTAEDAESMTDAEFDALLAEKQLEKREREEKAALEAEQRRIEAERLAAERAELERQRAAQEAEQARLAEEKRKLEAEAAEQRRKVELEKARAEAAEKAAREERERIEREAAEAKARAEREAAEAKAKADREEAERQRREAMKPDHMKLVNFAEQLRGIHCPVLSDLNKQAEADVAKALGDLQATVCGIAQRIEEGRA